LLLLDETLHKAGGFACAFREFVGVTPCRP